MNEVDFEKNKHLGEVLKLARIALNEEYLKKQQAQHQEWKVACDQLWLTKGMLLPYTSAIEYPTEQDVINRGVQIYNTLHPEQAPKMVEQVAEVIVPVEAKAETATEVETTTDEVVPELVIEELPVESTVVIEAPAPDLSDKFKSLFTKWGGRGTLPEDTV